MSRSCGFLVAISIEVLYNDRMILYVDETENDEYFIVTGLLVDSREDIVSVYNRFKKRIEGIKISDKKKARLFTEFKSTLLDSDFCRIKIKMLEELSTIENCIVYSCYIKKGRAFPQELKENTYITLISKIVSSIEQDISVVFDTFNKRDFEERIIDNLANYGNVQASMARDSQKEEGLQYVDNICSVIRMEKSKSDRYNFYKLICKYVKEV